MADKKTSQKGWFKDSQQQLSTKKMQRYHQQIEQTKKLLLFCRFSFLFLSVFFNGKPYRRKLFFFPFYYSHIASFFFDFLSENKHLSRQQQQRKKRFHQNQIIKTNLRWLRRRQQRPSHHNDSSNRKSFYISCRFSLSSKYNYFHFSKTYWWWPSFLVDCGRLLVVCVSVCVYHHLFS